MDTFFFHPCPYGFQQQAYTLYDKASKHWKRGSKGSISAHFFHFFGV